MSRNKKKLGEIGKTSGKVRDLVPASDAVKSAIAYMKEIENFFSEKSHGRIPVYPLLWLNLQGKQQADQPAMISGRLFHETNCFIRPDPNQGIEKRELKDVIAREKKPNGEIKYNFVSDSIVKKMDSLIKNRDSAQIDEILNSVVHDIEHNPVWSNFWQERVGTEGVDVKLQTKVLQSLVYKMMGDCYQSYLAKNDVSIEVQRTARNFVNALNEAAKTVTLSAPITPLSSVVASSKTPVSSEPPTQRLRRANAYSKLPIKVDVSASSAPSVQKTQPMTRVRQMAQDYEREREKENVKPTTERKKHKP